MVHNFCSLEAKPGNAEEILQSLGQQANIKEDILCSTMILLVQQFNISEILKPEMGFGRCQNETAGHIRTLEETIGVRSLQKESGGVRRSHLNKK